MTIDAANLKVTWINFRRTSFTGTGQRSLTSSPSSVFLFNIHIYIHITFPTTAAQSAVSTMSNRRIDLSKFKGNSDSEDEGGPPVAKVCVLYASLSTIHIIDIR